MTNFLVGQTSTSARDLQVPLSRVTANPTRPTWTSAADLEVCPTKAIHYAVELSVTSIRPTWASARRPGGLPHYLLAGTHRDLLLQCADGELRVGLRLVSCRQYQSGFF